MWHRWQTKVVWKLHKNGKRSCVSVCRRVPEQSCDLFIYFFFLKKKAEKKSQSCFVFFTWSTIYEFHRSPWEFLCAVLNYNKVLLRVARVNKWMFCPLTAHRVIQSSIMEGQLAYRSQGLGQITHQMLTFKARRSRGRVTFPDRKMWLQSHEVSNADESQEHLA